MTEGLEWNGGDGILERTDCERRFARSNHIERALLTGIVIECGRVFVLHPKLNDFRLVLLIEHCAASTLCWAILQRKDS